MDVSSDVIHIRHPPVVGVQVVGDVTVPGVGGLRRGVRAVRRRGAEDAGLTVEESVHLRHGVAEAVEEHDLVRGNPDAVSPVDLLRKELAGLGHALRIAVGPGRRLVHEVGDRVTDPRRGDLSLLHRISDVLPRELDAQTFELMGDGRDLPDLVLEVRRADVKEVSTHGSSQGGSSESAQRLFERGGRVRRGVAVFYDDRCV